MYPETMTSPIAGGTNSKKKIEVTRPFLPPVEEYEAYVRKIWGSGWLTNQGPLVKELEIKLRGYLDFQNLLFIANGTVALQIAIKALDLKGEIITTPFSYVATTSSIVWEACKPVFADIDPETFNINPQLIEAAITPQTTAILATHCFGNPCDITAIEVIAKKHGLKVIYDAAHCFGTNYNGRSVFAYGDVSTTSFHATKLYHTVEGGAVFTPHEEVLHKLSYMRNFGHNGHEAFYGIGINGKNSEFHAAMGLLNLKYIEVILEKRKQLSSAYDEALKPLGLQTQKITAGTGYNYAYYPVVFRDEVECKSVKDILEGNQIFPRRYFYPSLSKLNYVTAMELPIAEDVSGKILCLPLYHDLSFEDIDYIGDVLRKSLISKA